METIFCTDVLQCESTDNLVKFWQGCILKQDDNYYVQNSHWQTHLGESTNIQFSEPKLIDKDYYNLQHDNSNSKYLIPDFVHDAPNEYLAFLILNSFFYNKLMKGYHFAFDKEITAMKLSMKRGD